MRRRRITRKPTKGESIFGGIVCFAMGCFGLFALPSGFDPVFAGFKAIWCLLAFGMGVYNFLIAAGKVKMGGYEITDDEPDDHRAAPPFAASLPKTMTAATIIIKKSILLSSLQVA